MRSIPPVTQFIIVFGLLCSLPGCAVPPLMHRGGIMVDSWAEVKADAKPVAPNTTEAGRAKNRRVEVAVTR